MTETVQQSKVSSKSHADHFYSERNLQALRESIQQGEQGKVVVKPLAELERLADET